MKEHIDYVQLGGVVFIKVRGIMTRRLEIGIESDERECGGFFRKLIYKFFVSRTTAVIFVIISTFFLSLFIRFKPLGFVEQRKDLYFYNNGEIPILTSVDGYYYLRLAKLYENGSYYPGKIDKLRDFPDSQMRFPKILPLPSFLLVCLSNLTGVDMEHLCIFLIPILASLVVIPLVLIGLELGGVAIGFLGALTGSIGLGYLFRTWILRLDTDALNLFFPFLILYFLIKALKDTRPRWYVSYTFLSGLTFHLFCWWYNHPGFAVPFLAVYLFALVPKERRFIRQAVIKWFLAVLFFNPYLIFLGVNNLLEFMKHYGVVPFIRVSHVVSISGSSHPKISATVSELKTLDYKGIFYLITGNYLVGIAGVVFFLLFLNKRRREVLILLPLLILGLISFKKGVRFAMFLCPFAGFGMGYLFHILSGCADRFIKSRGVELSFKLLIFALVLVVSFPYPTLKYNPTPLLFPQYADTYLWLRNNTPLKSVIWSWWDYGLPISAIGERTVYIDGMHFGCRKSYCIAKSICTSSEEEFKKIVSEVTSLGNKCSINNKHHLYTHVDKPVYLIYSFDLMRKTKRLFYLSGLDKGVSEPIWFFSLGRCDGDKGKILCKKGSVDTVTHDVTAVINGKRSRLVVKRFVFVRFNGNELKHTKEINLRNKGLTIEVFDLKGSRLVFAMSEPVYNSMLNRMFMLGSYNPKHFQMVYSAFPFIRVYEVKKGIWSE